ncbi:hypothetical protein GWI33_018640 [Rhynchophorus ferrugineus]|uniref:Uncharacterized protein n=1 Tax=Rhynchophorus ferrugineus TaxID=354439 RepID=A0A834HVG9_RHYFE|nr:hypothetical protein GWI33_018640 [Rhynchophorus ferrugineus]
MINLAKTDILSSSPTSYYGWGAEPPPPPPSRPTSSPHTRFVLGSHIIFSARLWRDNHRSSTSRREKVPGGRSAVLDEARSHNSTRPGSGLIYGLLPGPGRALQPKAPEKNWPRFPADSRLFFTRVDCESAIIYAALGAKVVCCGRAPLR